LTVLNAIFVMILSSLIQKRAIFTEKSQFFLCCYQFYTKNNFFS